MRVLSVLLLALRLAEPATSQLIAVRAGKLIDPKSGTVASGAVIVIEDGKVKAVGPTVAVPADAQVIDLSDMTVLPGLISCPRLVASYVNDLDPRRIEDVGGAARWSSSGQREGDSGRRVHDEVRDVGTYRAFVDVAMRDAIAKGYFPGPRMYVAGAYLTITGGGGAMSGGLAPDIGLPWDLKFGVADGVDQVRQRVRDIAQHGVDLIKLLATGAFHAWVESEGRRVHRRRAPRGCRGGDAQGAQGRGPRTLDRRHQARGQGGRRLDRARRLHRRRRSAST